MNGRRVVVVGYGVTGRAVAAYLSGAGDRVSVLDDRPTPDARSEAAAAGVELAPTPATPETALRGADLVVTSPGVPVGHPVFSAAAATGVPVVSEIELAYERLAGAGPEGPRLVAVTGTNGKTTVTTLVAAILEAGGRRALAAGNIGVPLIEAVATGADVVVAEVSSFQLQFTARFRPAVSCWLNLAPDHLDWHPDLGHYARAKARIWANQGAGDTAVWNADDPEVARAAAAIPAGVELRPFTVAGTAGWHLDGDRLVAAGGEEIMARSDLPRDLPHDVANALAAAAAATAAGATAAACRAGLAGAPLLPHRVSLVAERSGVSWYDDSKATTPASVLAAVRGFQSVVLIAGGRNKGLDLGALAATVPPVRAVVAIGEAAPEVAAAFSGLVPVEGAGDMDAAVARAARLADPGDAVLLSPGCASFDWYRSYGARGDHFAEIVEKLPDKKGIDL